MVLGITGLQGVGLLGWSVPLDTGGCRLVGKAASPPSVPQEPVARPKRFESAAEVCGGCSHIVSDGHFVFY